MFNRLGLPKILKECFGTDRSELIKTAALYIALRGNNFDGVFKFSEIFLRLEKPFNLKNPQSYLHQSQMMKL
jgi:hypothetical protein